MVDHVGNLKLAHLVELSKLGDGCAELQTRIERWLSDHDVVYDGQPIPFVLMPHFVSPRQIRRVRRAVEVLARVLDRFCDAYPRDEALRRELALPDWEDALIRLDPGFPRKLRVCRLDAFLQGDDVRFLEFNADSPAGIGYTDVLHEGLSRLIDLPGVDAEFETTYTPMLPRLVDTLLDAYSAFREGRPGLPATPRLAIVDVPGAPTAHEFAAVSAAARDAGLEAVTASTEEIAYDGTTLRAHGEPVQLVSRRVMAEQVAADGDHIAAAARERAAAIVNPFAARVANNKRLLALLQDPRFSHLVERPEADVIRETVPWTRVLRSGRTTYGGWVVDLLPFASDNRERLVLKPASEYGGHGVTLGSECAQSEWDGLIDAHAAGGDYIVQELVPVPEEMFPIVEDGRVQMRLKRFNINPFAIDGRYAGSITRISDRAVINVSAGGGLLPSVVGRHKRPPLSDGGEEDPEEDAIA